MGQAIVFCGLPGLLQTQTTKGDRLRHASRYATIVSTLREHNLNMFCRNCGAPMTDANVFCVKCGTPVAAGSAPPPQYGYQPTPMPPPGAYPGVPPAPQH